MSRDLDARARQAAAGLKATMSTAELTSVASGTRTGRRRLLFAVLRPAWIAALLLVGSAVGLAVVLDSSPAPVPLPPTTTIATTTTIAPTTTSEPAPPTSAAVVPVAPTTTAEARDTEPPTLEITTPEDGATFEEKKITFAGVTEPGARVFAGPYEADVTSSGEWHIVLVLADGKNVARFVARDQAGNESEASVTVYYVAAEPTTTTTIEKEIAEFSAFATFGSCSVTPPYDEYYGTGQPGSVVEVSSEYGSKSVEVGPDGGWEVKVIFETAPPNETFVVHIEDQYGRKADFEFIYTP